MWSKLRLKQFFMIAVFRTYWPSSCSEGKGLWFWSDFLWPVPAGWGGAITRTPAHGDTTGPAHPLGLCVVTLQPKWAQPPPHQRLHHQTGTSTTLFSLNSTVGAVRFWLLLIWTSEVDLFASCESCFFYLALRNGTTPIAGLWFMWTCSWYDDNPVWFSKANCRCHVQYTFIFKINGKKFILHSYLNTTQKTTLCPSQIRTRMGENVVKKWCKQCRCLAAVAKDMVPVILVFSLLVFSKLFAGYLVHHL